MSLKSLYRRIVGPPLGAKPSASDLFGSWPPGTPVDAAMLVPDPAKPTDQWVKLLDVQKVVGKYKVLCEDGQVRELDAVMFLGPRGDCIACVVPYEHKTK